MPCQCGIWMDGLLLLLQTFICHAIACTSAIIKPLQLLFLQMSSPPVDDMVVLQKIFACCADAVTACCTGAGTITIAIKQPLLKPLTLISLHLSLPTVNCFCLYTKVLFAVLVAVCQCHCQTTTAITAIVATGWLLLFQWQNDFCLLLQLLSVLATMGPSPEWLCAEAVTIVCCTAPAVL